MKHTLIGIAAAAAAAAAGVTLPTLASGQANLRTAPSSRATTEVTIAPQSPEGQPGPPPKVIKIDYGQPHARGRQVAGALEADLGKVWRLGANANTVLTTDVDLLLGGTTIPKGSYALLAETTPGAWKLIVNKNVTGNPMEPDASADLARIPLTSRPLSSPIESLTMWLIPAPAGALSGELRIAWGTLEHSVAWSVKQ